MKNNTVLGKKGTNGKKEIQFKAKAVLDANNPRCTLRELQNLYFVVYIMLF